MVAYWVKNLVVKSADWKGWQLVVQLDVELVEYLGKLTVVWMGPPMAC